MNTVLVGHGAALLAATAGAGLLHFAVFREDAPARVALSAYAARVDRTLEFLRSGVRGAQLAWAQGGAFVLVAWVAWSAEAWALLLVGVSAIFAPELWLERRRGRRVVTIEEQLSGWLVSVAGALRAGNPIGEALDHSLAVTGGPLADEVRLTLDEHRLGMPLDKALEGMSHRVRSRAVNGAVFVLALATRTGGDVPRTLERAAESLRELARLEGVVRAKTSEGKAQALVISIIPAPLVALIEFASSGFFSPLTESRAGHAVIAASGALWIVAILIARRIVAVEV